MDIYREEILDNYKHPKNYGKLAGANANWHEANTSCGDALDLTVFVEDGKVSDIKFEGVGCAVSIASASMLFDRVKGMSTAEIKKIAKEEVLENFGETMTSGRIKCALLSLNALNKLIDKYEEERK